MPFIIYNVKQKAGELSTYSYLKKVSLAGRKGPIATYVQSLGLAPKDSGIKWHLSEQNILLILGQSVENSALIVDLKPKVERNVSLYRIEDVWGDSRPGWTPIMLSLRTLYVDLSLEDADSFKKSFNDKDNVFDGDLIHEFLYLQGGFTSGGWSWGPIGSVNAPLLWPGSLKFSYDKIIEKFRGDGINFEDIVY